jgi:Uma2 family endonuclease
MNIRFDPPMKSIGQLLRRLGDVPADRVRLDPAPGTATVADLLKPENENCELVDGTLVEKPVGNEESFLGSWLNMVINQFVTAHNLGYCTGEQGFYELPGGTVRGPDVAFTSWDRLPGRRRTKQAIPLRTPNFVVEVLSPGNTRAEMDRKREEYFHGGVQLLWEIDPRKRTARVYTALDRFTDLTAADTLTGDPVLPGFTLPLAALCAELDRHG